MMADQEPPAPTTTEPTPATTSPSTTGNGLKGLLAKLKAAIKRFLGRFPKLPSVFSYLGLVFLGGLALGLHFVPIPKYRDFAPMHWVDDDFTPSWDLSLPQRTTFVPLWAAALLSSLIPIIIFAIVFRSAQDVATRTKTITGVIFAVIFASLISILLRLLIGGYAPDFWNACNIDNLYLARTTPPETGSAMVSTREACYDYRKQNFKESMMSFPCGPVTLIFAGYGFLFLWLSVSLGLKTRATNVTPGVYAALLDLSVIIAVVLSGLAYANNKCHLRDWIAGAVIGFASAVVAYRRFISGTEGLDVAAQGDAEAKA